MKDNKLFKISIAEIAVGAVLELLALAKVMGDSDILAGMGSGILAVGAVQMFRAFRIQSNPEYRKRMETAAKDERYAFISMKAKEAAFGIYLIITAVLCIGWMLCASDGCCWETRSGGRSPACRSACLCCSTR